MTARRRVKVGLAALVTVTASAFFAAPALADTQPDPQATNIPYLAWRGEQVRLVKCDPDMFGAAQFLLPGVTLQQFRQAVEQQAIPLGSIFNADFLLVDWSGDPHLAGPQLEPGTQAFFFRSFDDAPCVSAVFESPKAGLAQIKLAVTFNPGPVIRFFTGDIPPVVTGKHDFLAAWMTINSAVLSNTAMNETPTPPSPGPITEIAGSTNDLQVLVTGSIPLLQNFGELGLGDQLILPQDWARLAGAVATFRDPANPSPSFFWDIHDEFSPTASPDADLHGSGSQTDCAFNTTGFVDTVDNCEPEEAPGSFTGLVPTLFEIGAFSRVWDGFTNPTVGPFDPQRAGETEFSNGTLDEGDAPMPSARIDFAIAPNTPGGINGVGHFCTLVPGTVDQDEVACPSVDKHVIYSRDGAGSVPPAGNAAHNLYGPFYAEYLPAAFPAPLVAAGRNQPEASGIDGPPHGNNFPGFVNDNSFYHFWDVPLVLRNAPGGPTACARLVGQPRFNPEGPQAIVVYTDEHGEARVRFDAGTGFFFDNLLALLNANGGCDLAGIETLGTADITATAKYPYQPVTAQPVVSNVVTKVITNAFRKTITCFPKGPGEANSVAAICVAEAIDIDGTPFAGETVCFVADFNASSIMPFTGVINGISLAGSTRNIDEEGNGLHRICMVTNGDGRAAVEIINSNPTTVDVTAIFIDEGLLRSIHVQFPITGQQGPAGATTTSRGTTVGPPSQSGSAPGTTGGNQTGGDQNGPAYDASDYRITMAKLVRPAKKKPYLRIRVNGPTPTVPVRLSLQTRKRVTTSVLSYAVETNRVTRISGLRLPKTIKVIRVSVRA